MSEVLTIIIDITIISTIFSVSVMSSISLARVTIALLHLLPT